MVLADEARTRGNVVYGLSGGAAGVVGGSPRGPNVHGLLVSGSDDVELHNDLVYGLVGGEVTVGVQAVGARIRIRNATVVGVSTAFTSCCEPGSNVDVASSIAADVGEGIGLPDGDTGAIDFSVVSASGQVARGDVVMGDSVGLDEPDFVNPATGNFRLNPDSPGIDAGDHRVDCGPEPIADGEDHCVLDAGHAGGTVHAGPHLGGWAGCPPAPFDFE